MLIKFVLKFKGLVCKDLMCGSADCQVWQSLLAVRTLVLPPTQDVETWLKFASLCRKSGRDRQARATLVKLLQVCDIS